MSFSDRARIRVEHIIREDYLVEGLEITEMFLDLILARVGLINLSNEIDPGMAESISSVIWVQPRIVTECPELKEMAYTSHLSENSNGTYRHEK